MTNETPPTASTNQGPRLAIADGYALLFYCALAIAFTWPAVIDINHVVVGSGGDELGAIWWLWGRINGHIDVWGCTQLVNWPSGVCSPSASEPLAQWTMLGLASLTNEIAGFTLYILISLPLSAMTAYGLLRARGLSRLAAAWGGTAMAFAPPLLLQASTGHLAYVFSAPVFLAFHHAEQWWCAHTNNRTPSSASGRASVKLGCALALAAWTSIYTGYFLAVGFVAMALAAVILNLRDVEAGSRFTKRMWGALLGGSVVLAMAGGAVIVASWALVFQYFGWLPDHVVTDGIALLSRDFKELSVWGARPWDYLRASTAHPVWGAVLAVPQKLGLHGSNIFESSLWPGLFTLIFAAIAMYALTKKTASVNQITALLSEHRALVVRAAVAAGFFAFLSLPPTIDLVFFELPTLSYFLYPLAPMFRVYSRAGIYAGMLLGAMSAIGVTWVLARLHGNKLRVRLERKPAKLIAIMITFIVAAAELLPAQPGSVFDAPTRPAWLEKGLTEPPSAAIAHMPWWSGDNIAHYHYLFWQRIHPIPMLNGQRIPLGSVKASDDAAFEKYETAQDLAFSESKSVASTWDKEAETRRQSYQIRWNVANPATPATEAGAFTVRTPIETNRQRPQPSAATAE